MKLIWNYPETDGYTYDFIIPIPFEYTSKDDFVLYVFSLIDEAKSKNEYFIRIFNLIIPIQELQDIEHQITTLEEWFETEKATLNK